MGSFRTRSAVLAAAAGGTKPRPGARKTPVARPSAIRSKPAARKSASRFDAGCPYVVAVTASGDSLPSAVFSAGVAGASTRV